MPDTHAPSAEAAVSRNPATGEIIATWPFQTAAEIEQVLSHARLAYEDWRTTPVRTRVALYRNLAGVLRARADEFARLVTAEMGKKLSAAAAEVEKCAATIEWFAENGPAMLEDEPVEVEGGDQVHVSYLPIGTILGVMPWNFPLWQAVRAAGPIMLSGNGFVLKHAPNVMGCAFLLASAYEEAGFPPGLFAVLHAGNDAVAEIVADRRIAAVTVTGSMRAGAAIASLAGRHLKKSLLELGGADPFIVLADADLDGAVAAGIRSRFDNAGQVCLAAKRFILERPIADEFIRRYVDAARRIVVGDPLDDATTYGPIARDDLRDGVHDQVVRTVDAGATLLLGGRKVDGPGYFYAPTVLAGVAPGMPAFDEEVFGPVAAMVVADDVEHAIALANHSDYGLSGNLWTADTARAAAIARRLETGGVFVNGFTASNARVPVGGVKNSGYGRELSHFGIREFVNAQTVWTRADPVRQSQ